LTERHLLERALRDAIHNRELQIVFQPIITASTGECETLEALARWNDAERGPVSPGDFIPLAERSGEIGALGRWVLGETCREAASWPGHKSPSVAVNVSAVQIESGTLQTDIATALKEAALPPSRLYLELTESVFAGNSIQDDRRLYAACLSRRKLRKRKSCAVASTIARAAGSGSMRAIEIAPIMVEKITTKLRSLSATRRPGIKGSIRSLYFVSSPRIWTFIVSSALANSGARAANGHPHSG
jgi:hypothetical protein